MVTSNKNNRARILASAIGFADELGAAGLRVDAVARAAGVNKRMIYHYFSDRAGLMHSVHTNLVNCLVASDAKLSDSTRDLLRNVVSQVGISSADLQLDESVATLPVDEHKAARIILAWLIQCHVEVGEVPGTGDFEGLMQRLLSLALPWSGSQQQTESKHSLTSKKPVYRVSSVSRPKLERQ